MNKYIFQSLLLVVVFLGIVPAAALEVNRKFGKPTAEEWELTQYEAQPDAEAVVLYKSMTATYELSNSFSSYTNSNYSLDSQSIPRSGTTNVDFEGTTVNYDVRMRIKILKESGLGYANVDLVYYSSNKKDFGDGDDISHLKVVIFSKNEKGKVSKYFVRADKFTKEAVDDYYSVLHIQLPQVKVGDIIEYQYVIESTRPTYLYDWTFQEEIPVVYSKCDLDIPYMLQFNVNVPTDQNITKKVEQGVVRIQSTSGDMQAAKNYPTNHYVLEGKDIVSLKNDAARSEKGADSARITTKKGKVSNLSSSIKNVDNRRPVPMPAGKLHLMINPSK